MKTSINCTRKRSSVKLDFAQARRNASFPLDFLFPTWAISTAPLNPAELLLSPIADRNYAFTMPEKGPRVQSAWLSPRDLSSRVSYERSNGSPNDEERRDQSISRLSLETTMQFNTEGGDSDAYPLKYLPQDIVDIVWFLQLWWYLSSII